MATTKLSILLPLTGSSFITTRRCHASACLSDAWLKMYPELWFVEDPFFFCFLLFTLCSIVSFSVSFMFCPLLLRLLKLKHDKKQQNELCSSEGSGQPGHPPHLISLHCVLYDLYWWLRTQILFRQTVKTDKTG